MKKITKNDLKKIALMGILGGSMLSVQANADQASNSGQSPQSVPLAHGCNGGSCGNKGNIASRDVPNAGQNNQQPGNQQQGNMQPQNPVAGGCGAQRQPQQQRASAGCNAQKQPQQQIAAGCGAQRQPQQRFSSGCNAQKQPQQQGQFSQSNHNGSQVYTQWETADSYKQNSQSQMNWNSTKPAQPQNSTTPTNNQPKPQSGSYTADNAKNANAKTPAVPSGNCASKSVPNMPANNNGSPKQANNPVADTNKPNNGIPKPSNLNSSNSSDNKVPEKGINKK